MNINRSNCGSGLVELLISVVVMGFVSAAIFGLLTSTMAANQKLLNKCDSIDESKKSIDRLTRVVRMGRVVAGTSSNTKLIIQSPKFSDDGYPYRDASTGNDALETHSFTVLPDPSGAAGEYVLQWSKDPGPAVPASSVNPLINSAQGPSVLLKGIVGPLNNGNLQIFQYIDRNNPSTPQNSPVADSSNYTGVIMNLEIFKHDASAAIQNKYKKTTSFAYKTEVFLRNNNSITQ